MSKSKLLPRYVRKNDAFLTCYEFFNLQEKQTFISFKSVTFEQSIWYMYISTEDYILRSQKINVINVINAEVWIGTSQVSKENVAIISEFQITSLEIKYLSVIQTYEDRWFDMEWSWIIWDNDGDCIGKQNTPPIRVLNYSFWFGESSSLIWSKQLSDNTGECTIYGIFYLLEKQCLN